MLSDTTLWPGVRMYVHANQKKFFDILISVLFVIGNMLKYFSKSIPSNSIIVHKHRIFMGREKIFFPYLNNKI